MSLLPIPTWSQISRRPKGCAFAEDLSAERRRQFLETGCAHQLLRRWGMRALLLVVGCLGCTGQPPAVDPPDAGPDAYEGVFPGGPCAIENVSGTIAGATLSIRSASCVYYQGQIARLTYEMTIGDMSITIAADPPGGCGTCVHESTNPVSFLWPTIGGAPGGAENYCPGAQSGCCAPHPELNFQLAAGTYSRTIEWHGRGLECPSDTGPQQTPLFPPGPYAARGRYNAYNAGSIEAQLPIEIIDP